MRTTTLTLLFLLLLLCTGFAQASSSADFKKLGIGIGYSFPSFMSDSIRPVELSLRYRVNDRHVFQLFAPVGITKTTINSGIMNKQKKQLFGIGLGYDYTLYNHSFLDLFVGFNASYQWYESRRDWHKTYDRELDDGAFVLTESIYHYWDRVKGVIISPHAGVRFSINRRVMIEPRINIAMPMLDKNSYSYYQTRNPQHESVWGSRESFYSDKDKKEFDIQAGGSIYLYYIF